MIPLQRIYRLIQLSKKKIGKMCFLTTNRLNATNPTPLVANCTLYGFWFLAELLVDDPGGAGRSFVEVFLNAGTLLYPDAFLRRMISPGIN